ncbi:site-2 protease family protein [Corallococcus sp. bb12-1]|uniref:site-2 protease family protein n=1 Tax=Corallococcus sp. bb12-1 TaxID=2996784 RepID=UPI00226E6A1E|nr:site-2 protease family protein [Corallococcus sp. bb12-1]MCY1045272.1 site-2 protease family protein [Corallococcus sp. bb12-1]
MHYLFVLLALGALLIVHELGHLVAARLLGVRVPRFTVGFGPPLLSFRLGGTQFVLGAIPLGASANLQGMNPHRSAEEDTTGFGTLGPLKRMAIILAGPVANYAVALGLLFALYSSGTHVVVPLTVGTVLPGSEAARAQLLPGDRLMRVDGKPLENWSGFVTRVADGVGRELDLAVERHGEPRTVKVRPRADERGTGRIGVSQQYVFRTHAPGEAFRQALVHTGRVASEALSTLVTLVRGPGVTGRGGPGALMRQESSDVASSTASGLDALVRAMVAASVALALLTMVPVPGLDGGRVLLLAVEAVSGRRIPPRVETVAQTAGFLFLSIGIVATAGAEIRRALPSSAPVAPHATMGGAATAHAVPPPASAGGTTPTVDGGTTGIAAAAPSTVQKAATPPATAGAAAATPAPRAVTASTATVGAAASTVAPTAMVGSAASTPTPQAVTPASPSAGKPAPMVPATPTTATSGLAQDAGSPSPAQEPKRVVTPTPP